MAKSKSIIPEFMKNNPEDTFMFTMPINLKLDYESFSNSHFNVIVENLTKNESFLTEMSPGIFFTHFTFYKPYKNGKIDKDSKQYLKKDKRSFDINTDFASDKKVSMYNLLVTGEDDAWEATSYRFFRNRFLEYTVEEIAEHFQVLDEDNLEALKSYPCIFAYEGADSEFKIGKITSIKRQTDALEIKYEFDEKITSKKFSEIEQYRQALDIRAWEMNRTHWAVKDADLYSVLGEIIPASISISEESVPLPKAKDAQQHASSVKEFINKVFSFQHDTHIHEVFYRGHSDKQKYKLEPSLFRKDELGNYLYLEKEDILYRELIVSNSSDFLSDSYTLDRLVRMQHYSLPTRLLDITSNPLIALYFTCKSSIGSDGEVVFFRIQKEEIKYYDSDTASCLANLAKLPKHEQNKINTGLEKHEFNEQPVIKRLVHFIRDEKPFFEGQIEPSDLKKIICVKSKKSNERITSQSGAFLSNLFKKTPFSKTGMN